MYTLKSEDTKINRKDNDFSGVKIFFIYVGAAAFCMLFSIVYHKFSHNVTSVYMTYLFAIPLILGAIPAIIFSSIRQLGKAGTLSVNAYNSGVAALTVSSLLRGIFEIAGTASVLQTYLTYAGFVMLAIGVILWIVQILQMKCMN